MSVETLMKQPHFPFSHFLADSRQYELSQQFWQASFEEGLKQFARQNDWSAWMNNPFLDGMPIWSAINRRLWRGISVQQVEYSSDPVWFKCWINTTDIDVREGLPYLFIETFISPSTHYFFSKLVKEWTDRNFDVSNFADFASKIQHDAASRPPLF